MPKKISELLCDPFLIDPFSCKDHECDFCQQKCKTLLASCERQELAYLSQIESIDLPLILDKIHTPAGQKELTGRMENYVWCD